MNNVTTLSAAALTCLALAGAAEAQDVRSIKIATDGAYPPYDVTLPDGTLTGFNVDVMRAICDVQEEIACEFVKQEWDGIIPGLLAKKYDAIAALTISEERKQTIAFANPLHKGKIYFFAKDGAEIDVTSEAGFDGLTVGTETGSVMQCYLEKHLPGLNPKVYSSQEDSYLDLENGRVDVLMGEALQVQGGFMKENPGYSFVGEALTSPDCFGSGSGPALRQGDDELAGIFNEGLLEIRENGTYAEINAKYFDIDVYPTE